MSTPENIHTEFHRMLGREAKEAQLKQRGHVFWFYGLSGSGKSTLANALERKLVERGFVTKILDGDNIRSRLNRDLGFSDEDRWENIRRISEVARLFLDSGHVVFTSFITPKRELRELASDIVGSADFTPVYVKADFETCAKRDVKGLYAKAAAGGVKHFTGKDSSFEEPEAGSVDWVIDTDRQSEAESLQALLDQVLPLIQSDSQA
ncbi:adenylyl-sulfate kinase [Coraliomargarita parva]|uniref:adenylyl-sulfate kinase n=1 Tax=Coraliomargarita parva TaxID=3014050 RepID=UPI0022B4AE26|nr:adenylyl-sulfate kinase [Coraliomargarita parva]